MTAEDIRLMLLKQRRLFGRQEDLARALGVSEQALSQFINRKHDIPRNCKIIAALGLEVVTVKSIKPKDEL